MIKENKNSKLSKGRGIQCPTCGAMKGNYCLVLAGPRKGRTMLTVIHTARLKAVGLPPQHDHKLAGRKTLNTAQKVRARIDHSAAGRKAWRTRRRNLKNGAGLEKIIALGKADAMKEQLPAGVFEWGRALENIGSITISFGGVTITCNSMKEAAELIKKLSN